MSGLEQQAMDEFRGRVQLDLQYVHAVCAKQVAGLATAVGDEPEGDGGSLGAVAWMDVGNMARLEVGRYLLHATRPDGPCTYTDLLETLDDEVLRCAMQGSYRSTGAMHNVTAEARLSAYAHHLREARQVWAWAQRKREQQG